VATAETVLFGSHDAAVAAIEAAPVPPPRSKGPSKLSQIVRKVADREIKRAIVELLDVGLAKVILKAWQGHDALLAAGQRTSEKGGREVVVMNEHTITSTHKPRLALTADGIDLGQLTISIVLSLRLVGITAIVQGGELVAVETGSMAASAKLSVEDVPITSRAQTFDAVAVMKLDHPVRLVRAQPGRLDPGTATTPASGA
jgi:hypothetical protein